MHEIRRADPVLGIADVLEGEDARVLEEAAESAAHPDVLGQVRHSRAQTADAAHPEVDRDAGRRGLVERLDDALV